MVSHELRKEHKLSRVPKEQLVYYQARKENRNGGLQIFEIPAKESIEKQMVGKW